VAASAEIRGFEIVARPEVFGCVSAQQAGGLMQSSSAILTAGIRCDSAAVSVIENRMQGGFHGVHLKWSPLVTVENNEIYYAGGGIWCMYGSDATLSENMIHGCGTGVVCQSSSPFILGNEIRNDAGYFSCWGVFAAPGAPYVSGNHIRGMRNGSIFSNSGNPTIENNRIEYSPEGIRLAFCDGARIAGNLVYSTGWAINLIDTQNMVVESNTVVGVPGAGSTGIICQAASDPLIQNNIVITDRGVECYSSSSPIFQCNNIVAPQRYIGDCSDQTGIDGNISVDPQFCGISGSGNYYLQSDSPCAPGNHPRGYDCGLIGAFGLGCETVPTKSRTWGYIKSLFAD
jgi:parallel beta-helix repeat protein